MSHFTLLVALPAGTELSTLEETLNARLTRFDERRRAEPRPEYFEGDPATHYTMHDVEPKPTTWQEFVDKHNEKYGFGPATLAVPGDDDDADGRAYFDAKTGRAYTLTTYNPDSKWDWWVIGGRWTGYFTPKEGGQRALITGRPGVFDNKPEAGKVDGGRKGDLDLEKMRAAAEEKAHGEYSRWEHYRDNLDGLSAKGWTHFRALVEAKQITIDEARKRYHAQPIIKTIKQDKEIGGPWMDCPIDRFQWSREVYVANAAAAAVPGYAFLDLKGEWHAPGEMGWFGMSTDEAGDRDAYRTRVNEYIDNEMSDQDFLIVLDLHI